MFFGYFLNTKKVTPSADSVISPAKGGPSSFPTRGFRPRPGPCSHSAAFRLRRNRAGWLPAPPFGFAAQNRARHFAARNHLLRLSASRPWLRHPAPLFCRSCHGCAAPGPQRQNPGPCSRSVAFRLRRNRAAGHRSPPFGFAAQNRARHFAARNHPVWLSASRPWLRHPAPLFCRSVAAAPRRGPNGKTPARFWLLS